MTNETREKVERWASEENCNCINESREGEVAYETGTCPHQLVRTLLTEIEALKAAQVACVKPLRREGEKTSCIFPTDIGTYMLYLGDGFHVEFEPYKTGKPVSITDFDAGLSTYDDAKAAAQADYERRILSALTMRSEAEVWNEAVDECASMAESKVHSGTGSAAAVHIRALKRETGQ